MRLPLLKLLLLPPLPPHHHRQPPTSTTVTVGTSDHDTSHQQQITGCVVRCCSSTSSVQPTGTHSVLTSINGLFGWRIQNPMRSLAVVSSVSRSLSSYSCYLAIAYHFGQRFINQPHRVHTWTSSYHQASSTVVSITTAATPTTSSTIARSS